MSADPRPHSRVEVEHLRGHLYDLYHHTGNILGSFGRSEIYESALADLRDLEEQLEEIRTRNVHIGTEDLDAEGFGYWPAEAQAAIVRRDQALASLKEQLETALGVLAQVEKCCAHEVGCPWYSDTRDDAERPPCNCTIGAVRDVLHAPKSGRVR